MPKIQFTLRDLFWLMLMVALGLGWADSYRRMGDRVERAKAQAKKWRLRTGTLEYVLIADGEEVEWHLKNDYVIVKYGPTPFTVRRENIDHEPSVVDPLDE